MTIAEANAVLFARKRELPEGYSLFESDGNVLFELRNGKRLVGCAVFMQRLYKNRLICWSLNFDLPTDPSTILSRLLLEAEAYELASFPDSFPA